MTIRQGAFQGRGECVPYARYGETVENVCVLLDAFKNNCAGDLTRERLMKDLPAGAARNAIDCALWDLEAKQSGVSVNEKLGVPDTLQSITAYTIPYGDVSQMAENAKANADRKVLKVKLACRKDADRLHAIRKAAPDSHLIVDANEGWTEEDFQGLVAPLIDAKVAVVEQPLHADRDNSLVAGRYPFLICADESCHDRKSLEHIIGKYDMINIKLDKTGGLTEASKLKETAVSNGLKIMVGCMVGTSLAMAPAMMLAAGVDFLDLDGPLLLAKDRDDGLRFDGSIISQPSKALWG